MKTFEGINICINIFLKLFCLNIQFKNVKFLSQPHTTGYWEREM